MEFRTEIECALLPADSIRHGEPIWTVGSCFSDEIGERLRKDLFCVEVNPLGTLFNPVSIARSLMRVVDNRLYYADDLFFHNGMWHSPDFHSTFSSTDPAKCLSRINDAVSRLHGALPSLHTLILTLGSSRVFVSEKTGEPVANCHKLPASEFTVRDLTALETAGYLKELITKMRSVNPGVRVILTVSPVRHKSYGLHADKLSKANLLIACDILEHELGDCCYFPAYEILIDDLRDYRFYAADMVHPSEQAADYVYEKFSECAFSKATAEIARKGRKLVAMLNHKPMTDDESAVDEFNRQKNERCRIFISECPRASEALQRMLEK